MVWVEVGEREFSAVCWSTVYGECGLVVDGFFGDHEGGVVGDAVGGCGLRVGGGDGEDVSERSVGVIVGW